LRWDEETDVRHQSVDIDTATAGKDDGRTLKGKAKLIREEEEKKTPSKEEEKETVQPKVIFRLHLIEFN